jgi:hypothetical protein
MSLPTSAPERPRDTNHLAFNLGAIALVAATLGVAFAYAVDAAIRARNDIPHLSDETPLSRAIAGVDLEIPRGWFRHDEQQQDGFADQIDLQLRLPLGPSGEARMIDVTLVPRSRVRASARLLDGVYLHQFMAGEVAGPPGLVGKPLRAGEGFQEETVWYDPLSPDPFVAKCNAPVAPGGQPRCLRTVLLEPGVAAVYGFDGDVLDNWRRFDPEVQLRLARIGL